VGQDLGGLPTRGDAVVSLIETLITRVNALEQDVARVAAGMHRISPNESGMSDGAFSGNQPERKVDNGEGGHSEMITSNPVYNSSKTHPYVTRRNFL